MPRKLKVRFHRDMDRQSDSGRETIKNIARSALDHLDGPAKDQVFVECIIRMGLHDKRRSEEGEILPDDMHITANYKTEQMKILRKHIAAHVYTRTADEVTRVTWFDETWDRTKVRDV